MLTRNFIFLLLSELAYAHVGSYILNNFKDYFEQQNHKQIRRTFANTTATNGTACACTKLADLYPDDVYYSSSTDYTDEATHYYDLREDLSPSCVFVPVDTAAVSAGVVAITQCQSTFAVRGAGHMPVQGAANINDGVLLALSAFTNITVSDDETTADVGPANDWYDVQSALASYGRVAIGGRLKTIGVSGLTLGGGIHYFSNKYGFAMDNVIEYEVVLANGTVVTASSDSNPDLFWGLKGGSNNLGIVTKFTHQIYDIPHVSVTIQTFSEDDVPAYIEATCNLALVDDEDPVAAGGVISITALPDEQTVLPFMFGVQAGATLNPDTFENFTAISGGIKLNDVTTLAKWSSLLDTPYQIQRAFYGAHTIAPDSDTLYQMYEAFRDSALENLQGVLGMIPTLTMQPIAKSATSVAATNGVGNTWGLDNSVPYIFWIISSEWSLAADNDLVMEWSTNVLAQMQQIAVDNGHAYDFIYLNDASDYQDALSSINSTNLERLKSVRDAYDPDLVFHDLVPGGFKIPV